MNSGLKRIKVASVILLICIMFGLLATACSSGEVDRPDSGDSTLHFQGILLRESSILVTESKENQLPVGELISLGFADGMEAPAVGSLYEYEIESALRESWPVQGTAIKAEEIRSPAGHTVITFDAADRILQHLPQNAHLIDVRTLEEYEGGHVSGAQNIPLDEIEMGIPTAVPETTDVIIVYCRSGNRSAQAGRILEDIGYKVILDAGGIQDYQGDQVRGSGN